LPSAAHTALVSAASCWVSFLALDEDTGQTLWQFKTGSSVNATAITYTHKGRQYVSIASGLGGTLANRAVGSKVPTGGSMWTFALMPE
jgi:alcohol dehydrogenase (cytochrome c)